MNHLNTQAANEGDDPAANEGIDAAANHGCLAVLVAVVNPGVCLAP